MTNVETLSSAEIRTESAKFSNLRTRDLAARLGVSEAQLVASQVGREATRIAASPDAIIPMLAGLGEVMALTRNESCVIEKIGVYENYHSGRHASMVLNEAIDLRMFPAHWVSAFAVQSQRQGNIRRSIQIFDAAGDAIHKVHLRETSNTGLWSELVDTLRHDDQSDTLVVKQRQPTEPPKADVTKVGILRKEWARMTDTHQFLRLTSKLKMNRLGAYRIVGEPMARQLDVSAANDVLKMLAGSGIEIMFFVGNRGCIEIHGGPIETLTTSGPWQNVLDPEFNMHLRSDHVAEIWAVTKPTQRGDAVSVETFDKDGGLIYQMFGRKTETGDWRPQWNEIVAALPSRRPGADE